MKAKPRFLRAALIWTACIGVGFSTTQLSEEVAYAVEWPVVQLEFDFVSDEVQEELACEFHIACLHIEVSNTAQCETNVSVDLGLENEFGQWIGSEEIIVPSPGFKGGFVIEIGTNTYIDAETFGVYAVGCSSTLANVVGDA